MLEIADDGAGIDLDGGRRTRLARQGLPPTTAPLDPRLLLDIICASGFSTRDEADRVSGRGVGMAVVRDTVQELGGTLDVDTEPGRGTTFRDHAAADAGDHRRDHRARRRSDVRRSAGRGPGSRSRSIRRALRAIEHNELMTHRGGALPIVRLARLFHLETQPRPRLHAIVVGTGLARSACWSIASPGSAKSSSRRSPIR